ncbi:hypothetical protein GCM10027612_63260 [Microbispora bryophytorum subsp. camponoti]
MALGAAVLVGVAFAVELGLGAAVVFAGAGVVFAGAGVVCVGVVALWVGLTWVDAWEGDGCARRVRAGRPTASAPRSAGGPRDPVRASCLSAARGW